MAVEIEQLLDKIADEIIISDGISPSVVNQNQKTIRDGMLKIGRESDDRLILYQKDAEANKKDLDIQTTDDEGIDQTLSLQQLANLIDDLSQALISVNPIADTYGINLEYGGINYNLDYLVEQDSNNPLNVSQFVSLQQSSSIINTAQAEEFLDTNIYELLPSGDSRQSRIIRFFQELNTLLPPESPIFDEDEDGMVDRDNQSNWVSASLYSQNNSISYSQDNDDSNIDEEDAFIHRLKSTANDINSTRTIEDIYNTILPYLTDILQEDSNPQDNRFEYQNQSSGYLQFRNLNQGIIIRNTNQEFVEGLDPNNPTWLTGGNYQTFLNLPLDDGTSFEKRNFLRDNPGTGFTITMWVRFLDKTSMGTLFNYGNPTLENNPFGFKLETIVVNSEDVFEDGTAYGDFVSNNTGLNQEIFSNSNVARFVRLQVREFGDETSTGTDLGLRDSHTANVSVSKNPTNYPDLNVIGDDEKRLFNYTHIPEDFNEWYFICANYNPGVIEPSNQSGDDYNQYFSTYQNNTNFWLNHISPIDGSFTSFSGYGNKCKVEIISRTQLLKARGYKIQ